MTATKKTTAKKNVMSAKKRGEKWLKDNHAKEGLFVITNAFKERELDTKNGKRIQFSYSVVPVAKGSKFDINNSIYMSALVNPDNTDRMAEMRSLSKHRYSITYRDNESEYNGQKRVFHNIIKAFPAYKQA